MPNCGALVSPSWSYEISVRLIVHVNKAVSALPKGARKLTETMSIVHVAMAKRGGVEVCASARTNEDQGCGE